MVLVLRSKFSAIGIGVLLVALILAASYGTWNRFQGQAGGACGNGVWQGSEGCDDGNKISGDGCSATCNTENGWSCTGSPSVCAASSNLAILNFITHDHAPAGSVVPYEIYVINGGPYVIRNVVVDFAFNNGFTFVPEGSTAKCTTLNATAVRCIPGDNGRMAVNVGETFIINIRMPNTCNTLGGFHVTIDSDNVLETYPINNGESAITTTTCTSGGSSSSSAAWQACPAGYTCSAIMQSGRCISASQPLCTLETNGSCGVPGCEGACTRCAASSSSAADCWPEGWIDAGGKPCCPGTTSIVSQSEISLPGGAIACNQTVAGNVCAPCGNGVCNSAYENRCNCPGDCGALPQSSSSAKPCKTEGQRGYQVPSPSDQCCVGLQTLSSSTYSIANGACVNPTDGSFYCTALCGNGQCAGIENRCNCPADCAASAPPSSSSAPAAPSEDLIFDDADASFMSYLGTWAVSTSGFRDGQHVHAPGPQDYNRPLEWGGWAGTVSTPGDYKMYATWVPSSSYSNKVTYEIDRSNGWAGTPTESARWTQTTVNQKSAPQGSFTCNGKTWQLLGNISMDAQYRYIGIFVYAENTAPRNAQFAADAVMLVPNGRQPNCDNTIFCGNGVKEGDEVCDDGNTVIGDGCASNCAVEAGWTCTGTAPTVCTRQPRCGNGVRESGEQCDGPLHYTIGSVGASTVNGSISTSYAALGGSDLDIADVTGDGKLDIVVANNTNAKPDTPKRITVLPGNGDGTLGAKIDTDVLAYQEAMGITNIIAGEFNGDGKKDVLLLQSQQRVNYVDSWKIRIARGNGNGTFQQLEPVLPEDPTDPAIKAFETGDFNGDGTLDIVAIPHNGTAPSPVWIYLSNGFSFQNKREINVTTSIYALRTGDFDGDGHLDFLMPATDKMNVFYGKGDGTFEPSIVALTTETPVVASDVNKDGRTDFITPEGVYLGQANRTFSRGSIASLPPYTRFLGIADMNGDGNKDIVSCSDAACWYDANVSFGNGNGTFQYALGNLGQRIIKFPVNTEANVFPADLNGDGRDDLVFLEDRVSSDDTGISVMVSSCNGNAKMCSSCQCATVAIVTASSSSSSVSVGPTCGNAQANAGETCDYASVSNPCPGGQMCSATCTCIDCIASGTPVEFEDALRRNPTQTSNPEIVKLDPTHALLAYYADDGIYVRVATSNGGTVTLGNPVRFSQEYPSTNNATSLIASSVDATHAIIAYQAGTSNCRAVLATVSGESVSFSSPTTLFQRQGDCAISLQGTVAMRRFDQRVTEKAVATVTGNQISWSYSEQDDFMATTFDKVPMGNGKEIRLYYYWVMVQRMPFFARLLASLTANSYVVAICNAGDDYCNCWQDGAICESLSFNLKGGKIVPIDATHFQLFSLDQFRDQWKVTPITLTGNRIVIGSSVDLDDFSFGAGANAIPAVASGRFFVDIKGARYQTLADYAIMRLDIAADGTVRPHAQSAGAFLAASTFIRAYTVGGSYPRGMVQVTNQCTAGPNIPSSSSSSQGSSPTGSCGNGVKEGTEQCEVGINCLPVSCFIAPCPQQECNLTTCQCSFPASSSSSRSSLSSSSASATTFDPANSSSSTSSTTTIQEIFSSSSSSSSSVYVPPVCGNGSVEGAEECELGVCCHNGFSCDTRTCQCTPIGQVPDQAATCGNFRIEAGEDCEDGISTPHLPCDQGAVCNVQTCRCPAGKSRCARWRSP